MEIEKRGGTAMERAEFLEKLNKASEELNLQRWASIEKRNIQTLRESGFEGFLPSNNGWHPSANYLLYIVSEELGELSKEISKIIRGKYDYFGILEEMSDVILGLILIKQICAIKPKDIVKSINLKIDTLEDKIDKNGYCL